ncbi:uncharacterized protein K452DRAFT_361744 [Aplosporella prunicola CBS 121167]|uniref:Uncharacterized protein n=1 Tax=Aplosporella prunicola CBS 121167 TaxID=1176127 RepID=A0A6A6B3M0_9PEZI|nr:uncharacterized protein K452DRAFT_361744 [Aplosporella prunicola CBS 121167]KAF2137567.1 hypothetical protein K452DRAFT_361744 [Aplosporella prunicola CBS 121167]
MVSSTRILQYTTRYRYLIVPIITFLLNTAQQDQSAHHDTDHFQQGPKATHSNRCTASITTSRESPTPSLPPLKDNSLPRLSYRHLSQTMPAIAAILHHASLRKKKAQPTTPPTPPTPRKPSVYPVHAAHSAHAAHAAHAAHP